MAKQTNDGIARRIQEMAERVKAVQEQELYFYLQAAEAWDGAHVTVNGRRMLQFASYGYLGLLGHPKINAAAKKAINDFSSGTHGVRILAGTTLLHEELEAKIASFKGTEASIVLSSGYVTNLATVSTLISKGDVVISDKLNHASIVDGCLLSRAKFARFRHNDMADLERVLERYASAASKLVVVDAVFSMDGDIVNLPDIVALCRQHGAWLMVDEAHSLGVLGETGRGIEEHFGIEGAIDIKMGTLSKTIPSVGGYIAGDAELVSCLKHAARAFVFSAALPPAQVAAAKASFEVIEEEPWHVQRLQRNVEFFLDGLKTRGFNTMNSQTPIVPIITGDDARAMQMVKMCQEAGIFVLYVLHPAVPLGTSRLRVNVTAAHTQKEIAQALDIIERIGQVVGVI